MKKKIDNRATCQKIDSRTICKRLEKSYAKNKDQFCKKNIEKILKSIISRTGKGTYKLTYLTLPEEFDFNRDLEQYTFLLYELIYPQSKIQVILCSDEYYYLDHFDLIWIGRNGETKYKFSSPNNFFK